MCLRRSTCWCILVWLRHALGCAYDDSNNYVWSPHAVGCDCDYSNTYGMLMTCCWLCLRLLEHLWYAHDMLLAVFAITRTLMVCSWHVARFIVLLWHAVCTHTFDHITACICCYYDRTCPFVLDEWATRTLQTWIPEFLNSGMHVCEDPTRITCSRTTPPIGTNREVFYYK